MVSFSVKEGTVQSVSCSVDWEMNLATNQKQNYLEIQDWGESLYSIQWLTAPSYESTRPKQRTKTQKWWILCISYKKPMAIQKQNFFAKSLEGQARNFLCEIKNNLRCLFSIIEFFKVIGSDLWP